MGKTDNEVPVTGFEWVDKLITARLRGDWVKNARLRAFLKMVSVVIILLCGASYAQSFSEMGNRVEALTWVGVIAGLAVLFAVFMPTMLVWGSFSLYAGKSEPVAALSRLGTAAGTGTAAGLVVAIVAFCLSMFVNSQDGLGVINSDVGYDPTMLLTLPAIGAITGVGVGMVALVVRSASQAERSRVALILSPFIVALTVFVTSFKTGPAKTTSALIDMFLANNPNPAHGSWLWQVEEQRDALVNGSLSVSVLVVASFAITALYALPEIRRRAVQREEA
ncbi:hypothetical protein [Gordonia sihwensis]|uniref:hypothetical protein n=1 Tax=Gordonia sihwensis TaxID=173559 RepID=UPI0005EDE643|nr:hypothetical protein [Gordonia sihwensis]KJR10450.1 hypothetical protein UG54_00155 [Gordonia sihwensis]